MEFRQVGAEAIPQNLTMSSLDFIAPALESLRRDAEETEVIKKPWKDFELTADDGRMMVDGRPLHPYAQGRLMRYLLGVSTGKKDFWEDNLDLAAEALRRAPQFAEAEEIQARVVHGQVLYLTDLQIDLGNHIDFFEPMTEEFEKTVRRSKKPMTLLGYLIDPIWTHLRMIYFPNPNKPYFVGVYLDTNYLFSRHLRGRAAYGLFGYDLDWESTLTMDNWWSVRSMALTNATRNELRSAFLSRLRTDGKSVNARARKIRGRLSLKGNANARGSWRQKMITEVGQNYAGVSACREALLEMDRRGKKSITDTAFALASAMKHLPFSRRINAERIISKHLKAVA